MSSELVLILSCFALSLVISYAWWSNLRVFFLQLDLALIIDDFRLSLDEAGLPIDAEAREFLEAVRDLIDFAPSLSPAVIGPISRLPGAELADLLGTGAESFLGLFLDQGPKSPELMAAIWGVASRLGRYLALETLSGWLSIARAALFGIDELVSIPRAVSPSQRDSMEVIAFANLLSRGQYRRTA